MSIKSMFFKDAEPSTENAEAIAPQAQEKSQPQNGGTGAVFSPNPVAPVAPAPIQNNLSGVVDEKFITMLEKLIETNNQPGLDYFEFKEAIANLAAIPMQEVTKFQTTFGILKSQGCTKEILLSSIDTYVGLIQNEEKTFEAELGKQIQQVVDAKRSEAALNQEEVNKLSQRINELNTQILTLNQEANDDEIKLKMTDANFKQSVSTVVSVLTADKTKITTYITE